MDIEEQLMRTMIKMDLDQKLWMLVVAEDKKLKVGSERRVVGVGGYLRTRRCQVSYLKLGRVLMKKHVTGLASELGERRKSKI